MDTFAFLGTPEIIIILVVALIVFGPQKLPEIGRQIGAAMREMRKMSSEVQRALDLDEYGGGGSTYNSYESGRWYDRGSAGTSAPAGTVAASDDSLALTGTANANPSEGGAGYTPEAPAHADPPGPPARQQTAPASETEASGQHGGAAVI